MIPSETKIFSVSRKAVGLRNQSTAFLVDLFSENHYNIDMIKNGKMKIDWRDWIPRRAQELFRKSDVGMILQPLLVWIINQRFYEKSH